MARTTSVLAVRELVAALLLLCQLVPLAAGSRDHVNFSAEHFFMPSILNQPLELDRGETANLDESVASSERKRPWPTPVFDIGSSIGTTMALATSSEDGQHDGLDTTGKQRKRLW
ncbi:hypothetical protein ElyMa_004995700 [Elysia marginata]|uniref:Uncharacterized protein n=1 Tax=Elysia marginata TaxID=1093978 RepID=A0AAV4J7K1_9GAST|nr:hypothetical protein ElyMa_004995700 [Elysia marginata]